MRAGHGPYGQTEGLTASQGKNVCSVRNAPGSGPVDVGPLSMNLNGMIDAAVNGGTGKYVEAFLSRDYSEAFPDEVCISARTMRVQDLCSRSE